MRLDGKTALVIGSVSGIGKASSTPITSATDVLHDIALCHSVIDVHRQRASRDCPSAWTQFVQQG
jgi:NAD(P)-dependent dehydrogenase (short-subunit alcohol dehydrogenase family)